MSENNQQVIGTWGDMGDGTYRNPVLFGDYSDPDCIRVGNDFWMICSEFNFMGIPVLHSTDLVNWDVVGRVFERLEGYDEMNRYGEGSWAPSIRYHDGKFYVFFCTPKEGLYVSITEDPRGKWEEPYLVKGTEGWEDPCPFWDDDGNAYLGRSVLGAGYIYLHRMSKDGKSLLDDGQLIYEGHHVEGTKIYKNNGVYYLVVPEGHVNFGYEAAAKAANIYGPYERKVILNQGNTWVNGPHQGALIDTPENEWWFIHFSCTGVSGRVVHLQPVHWVDGWPMVDGPVYQHEKPNLPVDTIRSPKTSDAFSSLTLGYQWQWNHNPDNTRWSLSDHPGHLTLRGEKEANLRKIKNVLTQRLLGSCGLVDCEVDASYLEEGQKAGLVLFGTTPVPLEVVRESDGIKIWKQYGKEWIHIEGYKVKLRITMQYFSEVHFFYDNGSFFKPVSQHLLSPNDWKGSRIGLFTSEGEGSAIFSNFVYLHDGPNGRKTEIG